MTRPTHPETGKTLAGTRGAPAETTTLRLETARLRLRPFVAGDLDTLHALWTDADVRRYLWDDVIITRARAQAEVERGIAQFATRGFGYWLTHDRASGAVVGFCGLRESGEPPAIELLYAITPSRWGEGLATEAARAVLRYGFEVLELERIVAMADPPNAGSIRVMEKAGMRPERQGSADPGALVRYALGREEFRADD